MAKKTSLKKSRSSSRAVSPGGFDLVRHQAIQKVAQRLAWYERNQLILHALVAVSLVFLTVIGLYLANNLTPTFSKPSAKRIDGYISFGVCFLGAMWPFAGIFIHNVLLNGTRTAHDRLDAEHRRLLELPVDSTEPDPDWVPRHPNGALMDPKLRPSRNLDTFDFARPRAIQQLARADARLRRLGTLIVPLSVMVPAAGIPILMNITKQMSPGLDMPFAILLFLGAGWFSLIAPLRLADCRGQIWIQIGDLKEEHHRLTTGQPPPKDRQRKQ